MDAQVAALDHWVHTWRVELERWVETGTSVLGFGRAQGQPVVLKVVRPGGEEWRQGEILAAFAGRGAVRVLEHAPGAMLLERALPGGHLVELCLAGRDDEATVILAGVIRAQAETAGTAGAPPVATLARAFDGNHSGIPRELLEAARRTFTELCATQSRERLLHGDLHHENVVLDAERGWLAIDPKGLIGEPEYEVGAALRNPTQCPHLYGDPSTLRARAASFARELGLSLPRVLSWAFAQAILAVLWGIEDGVDAGTLRGWLALAERLEGIR